MNMNVNIYTKKKCVGYFFILIHINYLPGQHDSSIYIQILYTATTQTDFMRIVAT